MRSTALKLGEEFRTLQKPGLKVFRREKRVRVWLAVEDKVLECGTLKQGSFIGGLGVSTATLPTATWVKRVYNLEAAIWTRTEVVVTQWL